MSDVLSGQRNAVNDGATTLYWPDGAQPVKAGQVFKLRSCHIEITKVHRVRKEGKLIWRAEFIRHHGAEKPYLLSRSGITDDARYALRAQDDPEPGTIDQLKGDPPEPEGVPPHELANLPSSLRAQQAYAMAQGENRRERVSAPLYERVRRLETARGPDLTRQFARIEQGVKAAESKQARLGGKVPSDRGA